MKKLSILSFAHFAVDFACALLCLRFVSLQPDLHMHLLLYNFCAFALQMPLGLLLDRFSHGMQTAAFGAIVTAGAFLFSDYALPAVILAGIGNALFHVGGGVDVLRNNPEKCTPLGVFVAPGAVGIWLGGFLSDKMLAGLVPCTAAVLCVLAVLLFVLGKEKIDAVSREKPSLTVRKKGMLVLILLFIVVLLRSAAGFQFGFSWKTGIYGALFAIAGAAGKAVGGVLADRLGILRASLSSLAVGCVLFAFSSDIPLCGILAVLLFNCTMPVTLFAAAKVLRQTPGFAFGLLTFALFLGLLPSYFGLSLSSAAAVCGVGACAVSAALLFPCLQLCEEGGIGT